MANTKNTIQNIPLTGPLCLNKLKTDVTQFEGYNEKNTTVFGGELTPLWEREIHESRLQDSYLTFNSKGVSYSVVAGIYNDNRGYHLLKNGTEIVTNDNYNYVVPYTTKLNLPLDAIWGGMYLISENRICELYLSSNYVLYYRSAYVSDPLTNQKPITEMLEEKTWQIFDTIDETPVNNILLGVTGGYSGGDQSDSGAGSLGLSILYKKPGVSKVNLYCNLIVGINSEIPQSRPHSFYFNSPQDNNDYVITMIDNDWYNKDVYVVDTYSATKNGRTDSNLTPKFYTATLNLTGNVEPTAMTETTFYKPMNVSGTFDNSTGWYGTQQANLDNTGITQGWTTKTEQFSPYVFRKCFFEDNTLQSYAITKEVRPNWTPGFDNTGHDGNGFIPSLFNADPEYGWSFDFICQDNNLIGITYGGIHINAPTSFSDNYVTISKVTPTYAGNGNHSVCLNYKSGNDWYCFMALEPVYANLFSKTPEDLIKSLFIDSRYILLLNPFSSETFIYDIEEDGVVYNGNSLGYVNTAFPVVNAVDGTSTTGCIYAGGFNAGFEINNANFVGYLPNPSVMTCFPKGDVSWSYTDYSNTRKNIQMYRSTGDEVMSAIYVGKDPQFINTTYPIDPNGNIILPYSLNSKIINGYSNNDMIKINSTAYPLMYYNNNQKIYAYQLLSSMENIEGIFSLQGQQYTFDDNNIYNVMFQNGIISNAQPICYKKNLTFLGTLPTSAIFYSFFNKTFYQFTGDAIVSKLFEANDIDTIYSVSQNPATQSLWICTDKGIYIMSDTDMFRLEYVTKEPIFFQKNSAIIVPDFDVVNRIAAIEISFTSNFNYNIKNIPIKLATKYYGLGSELKANMDCWYIRLHDADHRNGKLKLKVNTITNTSFETEEKTFDITQNMYDANDQIYIRYQPKYQTAVAMQLELESDIAIYQISLGVNATDAVTQQSKFNF